jgi:hypothetical protein
VTVQLAPGAARTQAPAAAAAAAEQEHWQSGAGHITDCCFHSGSCCSGSSRQETAIK